jgi:hypothetical protein
MLNTTNQSINLPDALIEKCFGQNAVHMQLSQIIKSIERIPKTNLAGTKISKMKSNRTCIR